MTMVVIITYVSLSRPNRLELCQVECVCVFLKSITSFLFLFLLCTGDIVTTKTWNNLNTVWPTKTLYSEDGEWTETREETPASDGSSLRGQKTGHQRPIGDPVVKPTIVDYVDDVNDYSFIDGRRWGGDGGSGTVRTIGQSDVKVNDRNFLQVHLI